jgi:DNA-binding transcriptional ArsR family regulator
MTPLFENKDAASAAADKLKVFAQPQRLMILSCLLLGERNVGEIAQATGIGQPALSQQLAQLRRAELVKARKAAKQVWYTLADESVEQCVSNIEAMLGGAAPTIRSGQQSNSAAPHGVASFARIL